MRVIFNSAKDPDYIKPGALRGVSITVDGVIVHGVTEADEERGFVEVLVRDGNGRPAIDLTKDSVVTRKICGRVVIWIPPNHPLRVAWSQRNAS